MTGAGGERLAPATPPRYVGRYRVLERIGRGAMGVVFAAVDEQLDRRVAVKLMLGDFDRDSELGERFRREARITGQLAHRNIVTVFDLGEDGGRPFIVMELLHGLPLAEYLRTAAGQPLDARIDLMMQLCDGLQNAHACGVIHRDIKPSNLLVQSDGTLKILDFGVARLISSNLTASGFLLGTPEYMAPEQAQGRPIDSRADIFSAAGVFYFMLAGRSPFASRDLQKMLDAIQHHQPPPLPNDDAPEPLRRILEKALSKSPGDRHQQCSDLLGELGRVRATLNAHAFRIAQAAVDRFRRTLSVIEERRELGRTLGMAEVDHACGDAIRRLHARFPELRRYADPNAPLETMDRSVGQAALEALQERYNSEAAALAAIRDDASRVLHTAGATTGRGWKSRAAALMRVLRNTRSSAETTGHGADARDGSGRRRD